MLRIHTESLQGEFCDEINTPVTILLLYDIIRAANILSPPRNRVSVGKMFTLMLIHHMQSGVTILTDSDFSEGTIA